jgi:hypothetical protein
LSVKATIWRIEAESSTARIECICVFSERTCCLGA